MRLGLQVQHREVDRRHGLFEFHVHVHHPVLQYLEAADRLAELLTLLAVFDRVAEHFSHRTDRLGAHRGRALVAGLGQ